MPGRNVNRALRAWGAHPPEWILALARACDETSQAQVARELDISSPRVNQVLGRRYSGRLERTEQLVRGQYMKETVTCPVLGEISRRDCQEHQQKARAKSPLLSNPLRVALRIECPKCPNREKEG